MNITAYSKTYSIAEQTCLQGYKEFESYDFVNVDLLTADNLNAVVGKTYNLSVGWQLLASFEDRANIKISGTVTNSHIQSPSTFWMHKQW